MEKSDRTEKREAIRTVEKGKHTGKIAPLSAGKQATAKTDSKEEINGQRTMSDRTEMKMAIPETGGIILFHVLVCLLSNGPSKTALLWHQPLSSSLSVCQIGRTGGSLFSLPSSIL